MHEFEPRQIVFQKATTKEMKVLKEVAKKFRRHFWWSLNEGGEDSQLVREHMLSFLPHAVGKHKWPKVS